MTTSRAPLAELATLFLRLGVTAFGGPAAHIAMMRDEVVTRREWLTDAEFLDLLAATHLIPGPNSTEMAIHLGYRRGGLSGLLVAGACFILPACFIVGIIAWSYVRYGDTPQVGWLTYGVGPVIIAIVAQALWRLGRSALTGVFPALVALVVAGLALAGFDELGLLGGAAVVSLVAGVARPGTVIAVLTALVTAPATLGALALQTATDVPVTLTRLGLFFLKVGAVLFGSGYVLLAFLRGDLTERWGWLTDQQLIDAITVGQVTPGPVFTTATFIGYLLAGWPGAVLATVGIFAPGFLFVALSHRFIPRLRASPAAGALLDGVVAASLGLMAAVTWHLARSAIVDLPSVVASSAAIGLLRWRLSSTWLVLGGAALGWVLQGGA